MLVLSRKEGESFDFNGQIRVTIVKIDGNRVRVGIHAPDSVQVLRRELGEWAEFSSEQRPVRDSTCPSKSLVSMTR